MTFSLSLLSSSTHAKLWPPYAINFSIENIFDRASIPDSLLNQYGLLFEIGFLGIEYGIIKSFRHGPIEVYIIVESNSI